MSPSECFKVVVSVEKVESLNTAFGPSTATTREGTGLKKFRFRTNDGPNIDVGVLLDLADQASEDFATSRLLDSIKRYLKLTFSFAVNTTSSDSGGEESTITQDSQDSDDDSATQAEKTMIKSEDTPTIWSDSGEDELEGTNLEIIPESEEEQGSEASSEEEDEEEEVQAVASVSKPISWNNIDSFEVSSLESTPTKDEDPKLDEEEDGFEQSRTAIRTPARSAATPKTPFGNSNDNSAPSTATTPAFLLPQQTPKAPASAATSTRIRIGSSSSSEEEEEDLLKLAGRISLSVTASSKKIQKRKSAASRNKSPAASSKSKNTGHSRASSESEEDVQREPKPSTSTNFSFKPQNSKPSSKSIETPSRPLAFCSSSESDAEIDVENVSGNAETPTARLKQQASKPTLKSWSFFASEAKAEKKAQEKQLGAATSAGTSAPAPSSGHVPEVAQPAPPKKKTPAKKVVKTTKKKVTKNSEARDDGDDSANESQPTGRLLRSAMDKSLLVDGIVFPKGKKAI